MDIATTNEVRRIRSLLLRGCLLCLLSVGPGCGGQLQYKQLPETVDQLPPAHELAATPFFPQQIHQCGPAALATVLNEAGAETTPEQLTSLVYLPGREGSLSTELITAVRRFGYLPYPLQPSLADLLGEIANGNPVVVLQNLGLSWVPKWHYAVVIGYDLPAGHIILRSGVHRRIVTEIPTFERTWKRGDYWALRVLAAGEMPYRPEQRRYLQASLGLEHAGQWQAAYNSYLSASKQWPQNRTIWMGLGNSAYQLKNLENAEKAYRQALVINDQYAPAYNNLAQVLADEKNWTEAEEMARFAVDLGGAHIATYKETLNEILKKKPIE